jgi:hypothetical protein
MVNLRKGHIYCILMVKFKQKGGEKMRKLILLVVCLTMTAFVSGAMAQQKAEPQKPAEKAAPAPAPTTPAQVPAVPAPAPEKAQEIKIEKFSGTVEKVDVAANAVIVKDKKGDKTFVINDKTMVTKGKDSLKPADLKKGMNVSVSYKMEGDKMMATDIKAAAPKAPKKEKK